MNKLILSFCEGAHDAAFVFRILKENKYKNFTDKNIKKFPKILHDFFKTKMEKFSSLDDKKFYEKPYFPRYILKKEKEEIYVLLYTVGGVSKIEKNIKTIKFFRHSAKEEKFGISKIKELSINFIFDAEEMEVKDRIIEIIKDLKKIDKGISEKIKEIKNGIPIENIDYFKSIGIYIFSSDDGKGKLEDILLPLIKKDNEEIYERSLNFLEKNKMELKKRKFYFDKSLIGILGQLQISGKANTVIIQDSNLINEEKIKNNEICKKIFNLFI